MKYQEIGFVFNGFTVQVTSLVQSFMSELADFDHFLEKSVFWSPKVPTTITIELKIIEGLQNEYILMRTCSN
jgi:hypothetical protein